MSKAKYKAELDEPLLADWCAFCEGAAKFDKYHFSTILMGVFLEGLTPAVDDFLRRFSQTFPPALYENLIRICSDALPDRDLIPWIRSDLNEKLALLGKESKSERAKIQRFLAKNCFTKIDDVSALPDIATASPNFDALYIAESNYVIEHMGKDRRMSALREALYHIVTSYALAHAIMSPLLNGKIDLSNYFEIYLRGGDYVVGADSIVVWQGPPPTAMEG